MVMLVAYHRGGYADDIVFIRNRCGGHQIMIGCRRNKEKVEGRGGKDLTVDIVISLSADEQKHFTMIVNVIEIDAPIGPLDQLMGYLRNVFSDPAFKHLASPRLYFSTQK